MQDLTHKRQDMYPERQSLKGPERDAARSACGGGGNRQQGRKRFGRD